MSNLTQPTDTCWSCRYAADWGDLSDKRSFIAHGHCNRFPPIKEIEDFMWTGPVVTHTHCCGEYKRCEGEIPTLEEMRKEWP